MDRLIFYSNGILNKNKLRENWLKNNYYLEYSKIILFKINNNLFDLKFSNIIYNYINEITNIPKCDFCNAENKRFIGFDKGYNNVSAWKDF